MPQLRPEIVEIDYTNWRGERRLRRIWPYRIEFARNRYHPEPQWLVIALDIDLGEERSFALNDIADWRPAALPARAHAG